MKRCPYNCGSGECSYSEDGECTYEYDGCYYDKEEEEEEE